MAQRHWTSSYGTTPTDGHAVALGERGEICVKGPQVRSGYWEKPEANAVAFTPEKDMIIVSGSNLTEAEVIAHCRAAMTAYKVPKSTVGKILRRELRNLP